MKGERGALTRRLKISFPKLRAWALADLLEDDAPNTSNTVWDTLPIKTKAIHDIWSGHQIFFHLEPIIKLPAENMLTYLPKVGDVFYYYRPPHYFRGAPYGKVEDAEIGVVYDRDSRPQGPRGPKAVNVFASLSTEGLSEFQKACEGLIYGGSTDVEVSRA